MKSIGSLSLTLLAGLASTPAGAQTYDLSWHTIDAGGRTFSTSASYELGGTIGQYDAGGPLNGTTYQLLGGFWPGVRHTLPVPPANDNCINATPVGTGSFPFDTTNATTDGPNEPTDCNFNGYTQMDKDVWFRYSASCSDYVTFDVCDATFNTRMGCYASFDPPFQCPPYSTAILGCSDDACGPGGLRSRLTLLVFAGQHYMVRVGGHQGASGFGTLVISPPVPAIFENPQSQTVPPGGHTTFYVGTSSADLNQWRRNGTNLSDGPTGHAGYIFGSTTNYLQLLSAQPEDAGDYDVIVTDSCGSVTSAAATLTLISCLPGDMNLDGERDGEDVQGFVECVLGSSAPICYCADMDGSGSVNGTDVALFVPVLLGT